MNDERSQIDENVDKLAAKSKNLIRRATSKKLSRGIGILGKKVLSSGFLVMKGLLIKIGLVPVVIFAVLIILYMLAHSMLIEYKGVDVEYVYNEPDESGELAAKKTDMGLSIIDPITGYKGKDIDIAMRQFYEDQAKEAAHIVVEEIKSRDSKGIPTEWKLREGFEKPLTLNHELSAEIKDMSGIDLKYRVPVELIYSLDEFLFRGEFRYPEQFVKPVFHDEETYELRQLNTKEEGFIVESHAFSKTGKKTEEKEKGVWDWGFGSIFVYQEDMQYEKVKGDWVAYDICVPAPEKDTPESFGWMKTKKEYYKNPIPFDERLYAPDSEEEFDMQETTEDIGRIITAEEAMMLDIPQRPETEHIVDDDGFTVDPVEIYTRQQDEEIYKVRQVTTFKGTVHFDYDRADVFMRGFSSGPVGETTHKYSDKHAIVKGYCTFTVTHVSTIINDDGEEELVYSYSDHKLRKLEYKEGGVYQNKPYVRTFTNEFGEQTIYNEHGEILSEPENNLTREEKEERNKVPYLDDYTFFFTSYVPNDIVRRNAEYEDMIDRIRIATRGRVSDDSVQDELGEDTDFTFFSQGNYTFDPADLRKPSGIKNAAEMREAIRKGCSQTHRPNPLEDNAELLLKLEKEKNINALFMISLAKTETNCGRDGVGKSKRNMYAYGGGGQAGYGSYAMGIEVAINGLSRNYLTPGGKFNGKPPRDRTPHLCELERDRIYCASGCDHWLGGMVHTVNRIGSSFAGSLDCSDVELTGVRTTFGNNALGDMFRSLWDILTGKNREEEINEDERIYGRYNNEISELDRDMILAVTQSLMNRRPVSDQDDLYDLPFWETGFNPFTDFLGYLNPYERPFDTSEIDITRDFSAIGGVEVARPYGSVVNAIDSSRVEAIGFDWIEIVLEDGKKVRFEGLMSFTKNIGDTLERGEALGRVGRGSHVRIFMWDEKGERINPAFILGSSNMSATGMRGTIMQMASSLIGRPYVWGAKGPRSFDCSGFVYYVYKTAGITIPGNTLGQRNTGVKINDIRQLMPGDMVHFNSAASATGRHVGIFMGIDEKGKPIMIHAGSSRTGVVRSDMSWWIKNGLFLYGTRVNELNN